MLTIQAPPLKLPHHALCSPPCRQWDPTKARVMYLHMATWRKANDIENLYETLDFPELDAIVPLYPHFYHKVCTGARGHTFLFAPAPGGCTLLFVCLHLV